MKENNPYFIGLFSLIRTTALKSCAGYFLGGGLFLNGASPYSSRGSTLDFSRVIFSLGESSLATALVWFYPSDGFVPGINQTFWVYTKQ